MNHTTSDSLFSHPRNVLKELMRIIKSPDMSDFNPYMGTNL